MKLSLPILCISLAASTFAYGSGYIGMPDEQSDIEEAISKTLFTKLDTNKDGKVSFDEVFQYKNAEEIRRNQIEVDRLFSQCDKNKDGKIAENELMQVSLDEFIPHQSDIKEDGCPAPTAILDMMDSDGNGFLTKKEMMEMSASRSRPPKKIREKLERRENEQRAKFEKKRFGRCDQDKDQFLTLREAASMKCHIYTEMFDAKDKDGDALLSMDEMASDVNSPVFDMDGRMPPRDFVNQDLPPEVMIDMKMSICDANDNGKLELTETTGKKCAVDLVVFNSIDINADGAIEEQELRRLRMKKSFEDMDKNGDGFLDKTEFRGSRVRFL